MTPKSSASIGVERGLALEEADGTIWHLDELWTDTQVRMNEGGCDPDGRFYCGSMAYDQRPGAGVLYRFDSNSLPPIRIMAPLSMAGTPPHFRHI